MYKKATENNAFKGSREEWHLNACVGKNGGPYDNQDYAFGYLEASRRLFSSLKANARYVDLVFYPLAYLYRHSAELYLKQIMVSGACLNSVGREAVFVHGLGKLFVAAKEECVNCGQFETVDWDKLEARTKEIEAIDPDGTVFRYAMNKGGKLSIEGSGTYNVGVLHNAMEDYLEELGSICDYLNHLVDLKNEEHQ